MHGNTVSTVTKLEGSDRVKHMARSLSSLDVQTFPGHHAAFQISVLSLHEGPDVTPWQFQVLRGEEDLRELLDDDDEDEDFTLDWDELMGANPFGEGVPAPLADRGTGTGTACKDALVCSPAAALAAPQLHGRAPCLTAEVVPSTSTPCTVAHRRGSSCSCSSQKVPWLGRRGRAAATPPALEAAAGVLVRLPEQERAPRAQGEARGVDSPRADQVRSRLLQPRGPALGTQVLHARLQRGAAAPCSVCAIPDMPMVVLIINVVQQLATLPVACVTSETVRDAGGLQRKDLTHLKGLDGEDNWRWRHPIDEGCCHRRQLKPLLPLGGAAQPAQGGPGWGDQHTQRLRALTAQHAQLLATTFAMAVAMPGHTQSAGVAGQMLHALQVCPLLIHPLPCCPQAYG